MKAGRVKRGHGLEFAAAASHMLAIAAHPP
jgi:hypothetical protein